MEKFDGSFTNVIKLANNSAEKLIKLVVKNFTSYDDTATFEGKKGIKTDCVFLFLQYLFINESKFW